LLDPGDKSYFERRWCNDKTVNIFNTDEILALWWLDIKMLDKADEKEEYLLTCKYLPDTRTLS